MSANFNTRRIESAYR